MKKLLLSCLAISSILAISACHSVEDHDRRHHRHDHGSTTTTTTEETTLTRPSYGTQPRVGGYGTVETQTTRSY